MPQNHPNIDADMDIQWQTGTAYVVETRVHQNLPELVNNINQCLPKTWQLWVFHSSENASFVEPLLSDIERTTKSICLKSCVQNSDQYNDLLLSEPFWQEFETENLLGLQVDTLINVHQVEKISELVQYDYVGSPWSVGMRRRLDYVPVLGGGGGACFSKRSARLNALKKAQTPRELAQPHAQKLNADLWFSRAFIELEANLPTPEVAQSLIVESVPFSSPFAIHKPWCYLQYEDYEALLRHMPGVEAVREGCGGKRKHTSAISDKDGYRQFLHRFARTCMATENFHQADLALQVCHDRYPDDAETWNLRATLAHKLGLNKTALRWVEFALNSNPDYCKAQENKRELTRVVEGASLPAPNGSPRYLLINAWGSGFGLELLYLLKQLLLAEMTNRIPVIHWGKNCLYNDHQTRDCFGDFFERINQVTIPDVFDYQSTAFPEHWRARALSDFVRRTSWRSKVNHQSYRISGLYYLNKPESLVVSGEFTSLKTLLPWLAPDNEWASQPIDEVYRGLIRRYLRPRTEVLYNARRFIDSAFADHGFVAIHLRGTDRHLKKHSNDLTPINEQLISLVESKHPTDLVFVMTDDKREIEKARARLGDRVRALDVARSHHDELGVHVSAKEKQKVGLDVLTDLMIATQARHFYGCGFSYLACVVSYFRDAQTSTLLPYDVNDRYSSVPIPGTFGIE